MTAGYLADTHILLWALNDPGRLPGAVATVLEDPDATVFFSSASIWEMSIKYSLGKLDLAGHTPEELAAVALDSGFALLAPSVRVCASSHRLPRRHSDPFDRLIAWQAIQEGIPLLSADRRLEAYIADGLTLVR